MAPQPPTTLRLLDPQERITLRPCFPRRPGPQIGAHVLSTGHGACWVDRWPNPRAILCQVADSFALHGDPAGFAAPQLALRFEGMIEASDEFLPLLEEVCDGLEIWPRRVFELRRPPPSFATDAEVRALEPGDAYQLCALSLDTAWVANTWGGPAGLASSGMACGAFVDGELASVAAPFFVGDRYEDIAVVTSSRYRGRGLNPACAASVAAQIRSRGRVPSWTTSPDNRPSLRVAEKLGFEWVRDDRLLVTGMEIPPSAQPPGEQRA